MIFQMYLIMHEYLLQFVQYFHHIDVLYLNMLLNHSYVFYNHEDIHLYMLYDSQQLNENPIIHDHDDQHMYKQYKCILHIVHNNNEQILLDDAFKRKNKNYKKLIDFYKIT